MVRRAKRHAAPSLSDRLAAQQNRIFDVAAILTGLDAVSVAEEALPTHPDCQAHATSANYRARVARQAIETLEDVANELSLIDDAIRSGR